MWEVLETLMIAWINQLRKWIMRIFAWLGDAKSVWVAVLTIPSVLFICWAVIPGWEPRIRIAGMFLELLGLGTVAYGLRETRKLFNHPSLLKTASQWLRNFPKFKLETRIVVGAGHIKGGGATLSAVGSVSPSASASLAERVILLERGLNQANVMIHETRKMIEVESRKHDSALDTERRGRELGDEKSQRLLQEAMVGGLYLETTGVVWMLFGITLATVSNEIASSLLGLK